ncbi:hypothetical protein FIBSPDRAFT_930049 [Athelia psychrophila]|uniref:F-box domain-containing protein n=1 Tax=Athelia psychrophila TaxID=1759441 RepID=A0A166MUF9_9AGAM|nr:hypothetical protein FIBSPDRAFT_930049 [Fibularhizoctonia sp. CBS 109695]
MASLPAELKSLIAAHLTAPAPCCPAYDLAALSLASVAWAAAARPHLLAVIPLSARTTPAFLPLLHPPSHNGKQISSTIPAHASHLAFEDTAAANMLLPRCAPLAHLRSMELRNLEWAVLSPDATAPLTSVFTSLTALGIHRATFPHAHNLRRLVSSFPALERLALSDIMVAPCLCNAYQPSERAAAMTVPKGLRSLTLDMGDATTGKRSQAEELLEWLANGDGCAKLATLDIHLPQTRFVRRSRLLS